RRLQLEVEGAAEALAQAQAPGAVDAAAEGRMDDELHAAGLVEEALEHQRLLRRQCAERGARGGEVLDELRRRARADAGALHEPLRRAPRGSLEARLELGAQPRHARRQLLAPARRLAQPERDRGRLAARVLDADAALLDAQDPVGDVA